MKLVYEASNTIEAHMILNLLEQAGISGRIDGEYLQGGVGDLQAIGFARVMVDESEYDAANKIVKEWDANQSKGSESEPTKNNNSFSSGVIGFIFGIIAVAIFYNTPVTHDGIDYNGDGKLDEKWLFLDGRLSKVELDRNYDGSVDFIYKYNREGILNSSKSDDDFNGSFETKTKYNRGNATLAEIDTDKDGFNDYRMDFKHGVLDTVTFFDPSTEKILKIQKFKSANLISAEIDTDRDGIIDVIHMYDGIEEIASISNK